MTNVISDWWTWNFPCFLVQASAPFNTYFVFVNSISLDFVNLYVKFAINVFTRANQPNCLVYRKTMPQRETVAGEATAKS